MVAWTVSQLIYINFLKTLVIVLLTLKQPYLEAAYAWLYVRRAYQKSPAFEHVTKAA